MKLGYLTKFSRQEPDRAKRLGFDCLEVHSSSWFGDGVWATPQQRQEVLDALKRCRDEFGISISAISHYGPAQNLQGEALVDSFRKAIELAQATGCNVVTAIAPRADKTKSIADNIPAFRDTYTTLAKIADEKNVKIAFENWPAFGGYPLAGRTMAYSPEAWAAMFDAVPGKALGLEFDPSHLYWQGIDHIAVLRQFKDRVYHVHAKDTEIFYDKRNVVGIYGGGWWTYRIPGLGEINWPQFIAELYTIGYDGGVCIEHEDGRFDPWRKEPTPDNFERGLRIGQAILRPLIV